MYCFVTKNKISQWIDGILFNFGAYATDDESIAERLRNNKYVEEVIEQAEVEEVIEPVKPVKPVKKARK